MSLASQTISDVVSKDALAALDAEILRGVTNDSSLAGDITDVIGVVAGIKPAAMIGQSGKKGIAPEILTNLGLSYETWPEKGLWYVSMDEAKARQLAGLHKKVWGRNIQFPQEQYEIGALLGYPRSSTDYMLERLAAGAVAKMPAVIWPRKSVNRVSSHFQQFILSPGNYREELRLYSEPLEVACRQLAPRTYAYLVRYYRRERLVLFLKRLIGRSGKSTFAVKLVD